MSVNLIDYDESRNTLEKIEIELLLEGIYRYYGFDFRNYAYPSIRRRILHRIHTEKLSSISSLQEKVLHDGDLLNKLLEDFSINVTEMFRDPSFFKSFKTKIIPYLRELPMIRIWHAGCSSGEEAYSMAVLLHEEGLYEKSRIYATDINEKILEKAKLGQYPIERMETYTKNYYNAGGARSFSEYYSANHEQVMFHSFLKENIVFAHHNLVSDHSFNEFHVIVCRNVMIYFNRNLQERVHHLFFDSLCNNGYLCLGNKEALLKTDCKNNYDVVDPIEKIYRKK
ncbi:CheR family methyltransferase [Halalkalibacter krulwichiae]|uniref:Chemotaxis protein methyltransferase Cher2 n=1 Tax=Halalkalibacter krulwichiae TaxID=199441 RepID=A0A1X9MGL9_9BACI|nr:protein-glutamate O-methyltransferase CheR [Halalkalibacter krulwichiae]ARK31263.1 Chemotaxis protein methyltransferase Cher2 [Halalkalibacter krulwichiae]